VSPTRRPTIAVVGGGIAGLSAAWELVAGSGGTDTGNATDTGDTATPVVHVLESGDRLGGKLASAEFAGRTVDLAADAFLVRRPEAAELCDELGLADELVPVGASGAAIWARGTLRMMPEGLNVGVPTRFWPLFRSGILTWTESLRVARDLVTPHLGIGLTGDRAVGDIVGERLGRSVVERLVDPLIGGINAGGVDDLSAAATMPALIAASVQSGSLMHRLGRVRAPGTAGTSGTPSASTPNGSPAAVFSSLRGSTASLAEHLTGALVRRGVTVRTNAPVEAIERSGPDHTGHRQWRLSIGGGEQGEGGSGTNPDGDSTLEVDGVVLAVPATEAGVLLAAHAPVAAGILSTIEYASVAVITYAVPTDAIGATLRGTGFLVPRTSTVAGRPALITGCTYLGRKWPHLARPGDELIRVSVGRFGDDRHQALDDDELSASAFGELARMLDITGTPLAWLVTRWPGSFPQYRVGHLIRVGQVEQAVAALDGMAVAGAALRGVGIPACIGSGRAAARRVLTSLDGNGLEESGLEGNRR
jgi:oxygen-dependent protoporphyrinogen oxidase